MKNIFEIFELIIGEDTLSGVQAISMVTEGAIERDFVHFGKEEIVKLSIHDEEKRMVAGPILVPNKMILRGYKEGDETKYYYVHFSADTVRKTAQRFMELGNQNNTTYQHMTKMEDVTFVESWVKEFDTDKSTGYGYEDMPIGTWFGIAKIDNDEVWADVKAGKVNGFSIEGKFADSMIKQSKDEVEDVMDIIEEEITDEEIALLEELIRMLTDCDDNITDENETLQ